VKRKTSKHCQRGSLFSRRLSGKSLAEDKIRPLTTNWVDRFKRLIDCVERLDGKKKDKVLVVIEQALALSDNARDRQKFLKRLEQEIKMRS